MKIRSALWALLVTIAAGAPPAPALDRVMEMNSPRPVAAFTLMDQLGKPRDWSTFAGKPTLVFFGFTHCPDVCPMTLQRTAEVKRAHASELAELQVVMISVDGERDTPAALSSYLAHFSKDFIGLTGPSAEVREIALRFSAPFFKDTPKGDGAYLVQHSSRLYAVDRQGRLRAELYDAAPEAILAVARKLLAE